MPVRVLFVLWAQLPALEAGELFERTEAVRRGKLLVEADKKDRHRVQAEHRRLLRSAVPFIHPRLPDDLTPE